MRLRNVKNKDEIMNSSSYIILNPKEYKGSWNKLFNSSNKINIEIGCGKGDFIINNALTYPDINFIAIEKYDSVIVRALQKAEELKLNNLKFIRIDAKEIEEVFDREIDTIYLNFSDPWPKKRHSDRRLTSPIFLNKYDNIFSSSGNIIMKTDNTLLFSYSLETLSQHGYYFEKVSLDLHNSDFTDNIMTEYEKKFSSMGVKINYLHAKSVKSLQKKC